MFQHTMKCRVVLVTVAMANKWLEQNVANRRLDPNKVVQYAKAMAAGQWMLSHQAIGIDQNGRLIDGQHRLHAILRSGSSVLMLVITGIDHESAKVIDQQKPRTVANAASIAGLGHITPRHAAVSYRMAAGNSVDASRQAGIVERLNFIVKHEHAIAFAIDKCRPRAKGITTASAIAVVARAFYTVNPKTLSRFGYILAHGAPPDDTLCPGDRTVIALRPALMRCPNGGQGRISVYRRTQNALFAFMEGVDLKKIYEKEGDLFLLPLDENSDLTLVG